MTNFTDHCYSHAFVARVNDELASDKTAIQMWMAIREHRFVWKGMSGSTLSPESSSSCLWMSAAFADLTASLSGLATSPKARTRFRSTATSFIEVCPHTGRRFNIATGEF